MTIQRDAVLWDSGSDRLCLLQVPLRQQYKYINESPCLTVGILYENANYKGFDTFTLLDHFYIDMVNQVEKAYHSLNGVFSIRDCSADTDGYIDFYLKNGKLRIQGQLGASFSSHSLRFAFEADQTLIGKLLENLAVEL